MTKRAIRDLYKMPGHLIRRLQQMSVSIFAEEVGAMDVTPVQFAALVAIETFPGIDQARVSQTIGYDRVTMSGVIDRLEGKELVLRSPSKIDRRAKLLTVTAQGKAFLTKARPKVNRVQERVLEPLSAAERRLFLSMLERLVWSHNDESRIPVDAGAAQAAADR